MIAKRPKYIGPFPEPYPEATKVPRRLYSAYLSSAAWDLKKWRRMSLDDFKCRGCGKAGGTELNVHHRTYERLGDEEVNTDLITLCSHCHSHLHLLEEILPLDEGQKARRREIRLARLALCNSFRPGEFIRVPGLHLSWIAAVLSKRRISANRFWQKWRIVHERLEIDHKAAMGRPGGLKVEDARDLQPPGECISRG